LEETHEYFLHEIYKGHAQTWCEGTYEIVKVVFHDGGKEKCTLYPLDKWASCLFVYVIVYCNSISLIVWF
jgi:hypothetical protein